MTMADRDRLIASHEWLARSMASRRRWARLGWEDARQEAMAALVGAAAAHDGRSPFLPAASRAIQAALRRMDRRERAERHPAILGDVPAPRSAEAPDLDRVLATSLTERDRAVLAAGRMRADRARAAAKVRRAMIGEGDA